MPPAALDWVMVPPTDSEQRQVAPEPVVAGWKPAPGSGLAWSAVAEWAPQRESGSGQQVATPVRAPRPKPGLRRQVVARAPEPEPGWRRQLMARAPESEPGSERGTDWPA